MLIIPLSHESGEVQRLPYITLGIIVLNLLLFVVTSFVEPMRREVFIEQETKLTRYYTDHLYLDIPQETFRKLSPGSQARIAFMKGPDSPPPFQEEELDEEEWERRQEEDERMRDLLEEMGVSVPSAEAERTSLTQEGKQAKQAELNRHVEDFEAAYENIFYRKYGYIPSRGGFLTVISSMFLHGGILHILFNMFFLYLSGCQIEDLWGRAVFPVFYLVAGMLAGLSHGLMVPESAAPCIGASGAVAAVMGAFMIRLYKTKIYFFYAYFFFTKFRRGTFHAPAYVMLPLWLAEQLLEALKSADVGSGVAFWAHIGGFAFGAGVATLFKVTGFEEKFIAPAIERKTNLVDENFSSGMEKLRQGDMAGAAEDLRKALENDPDNPIVHSELSKIYCKQGEKKGAVLELKRAVNLYMKQGLTESAVDDYLEIRSAFPDIVLDPLVQMTLIEAIEAREMYPEAATACKSLFSHCQRQTETKDGPEAVRALTRYGDICLHRLQQPRHAFKAYKTLLESCKYLTSDQKRNLKAKAQEAVKAAKNGAKQITLKQKEPAIQKDAEKTGSIRRPRPDIPLKKKIRIIQEVRTPEKYEVKTVAPYQTNKVLSADGGMDMKRPSELPVLFRDIFLICVFEIEKGPSVMYADLFVGGKTRPYRILSNRIIYSEFLKKSTTSSFENFRLFILHTISETDSVYLDQETMTFLKTKKTKVFPTPEDVGSHEKNLWKQLMGEVRFQCEMCYEVYWIDGRKVPKKGAKTTCKKCGQGVFVRPAHYAS